MGFIKFVLVLLLCVPIAFLLWCTLSNLVESLKKQHGEAERARRNKEIFQKDYPSKARKDYSFKRSDINIDTDRFADAIERFKKLKPGKKSKKRSGK